MNRLVRQLGKDSLVYGVGGALAKSIGFLLLPVFTRIFSPAEYGHIEMAMIIATFVAAMLDTGMDSAQSFYFYEQKSRGVEAQARVVSAIGQWRMTGGVIVVVIALALSPILNVEFFRGQMTWAHFVAVLVGAWFVQHMAQSAELFRLLYKPWSYIGVTLTNTAVFAATAVVLTAWFRLGTLGYFLAYAIGGIVATIVGWSSIRRYVDFKRWHVEWWPRILRFGLPLVPASLAMYILNTADRWFINYFHGDSSLGLFAVGARFAGVLMALVLTFRQALWPIVMDVIHTDDGPPFLRGAARLYLGATSAGVVVVTAISPLLLTIFVAPAFRTAYPLVGVLAWQAVFYGAYLIVSAGIWKREKTVWAAALMGVAVAVNIALDVILIPRFGNLGAATATASAFFVWIAMTLWVSEMLWRVRYPVGVMLVQILIALTGSVWILRLQLMNHAMWEVAAVATAALVALALMTLTRSEIEWIGRTIRSLRLSQAERVS